MTKNWTVIGAQSLLLQFVVEIKIYIGTKILNSSRLWHRVVIHLSTVVYQCRTCVFEKKNMHLILPTRKIEFSFKKIEILYLSGIQLWEERPIFVDNKFVLNIFWKYFMLYMIYVMCNMPKVPTQQWTFNIELYMPPYAY